MTQAWGQFLSAQKQQRSFYHYPNTGHNRPDDFCRCSRGHPPVDRKGAVSLRKWRVKNQTQWRASGVAKAQNRAKKRTPPG